MLCYNKLHGKNQLYENKRNDYENPFLLTIVLNWDVLNESQKVYCKMFMRKFTQIATF